MHFCCFIVSKIVQIFAFFCVKFLVQKSGRVKFFTNLMSETESPWLPMHTMGFKNIDRKTWNCLVRAMASKEKITIHCVIAWLSLKEIHMFTSLPVSKKIWLLLLNAAAHEVHIFITCAIFDSEKQCGQWTSVYYKCVLHKKLIVWINSRCPIRAYNHD